MKYFIDTEFIEGFHKPIFGKCRHFIDLISIGIVTDDGRHYYAVSNEFDIEAVWNKFNVEKDFSKPQGLGDKKIYWLRDNVLMPIFYDMAMDDFHHTHFKDEWDKGGVGVSLDIFRNDPVWSRDLWWLKKLIKKYGKPNAQIAKEIKVFVYETSQINDPDAIANWEEVKSLLPIEFYAYYADYDWVLFCSLFGRMIDLPKGFPMYCHDLKQSMDEAASGLSGRIDNVNGRIVGYNNFKEQLEYIKSHPSYPKQTNEHNALADARWNYELYKFINLLK